MQEQLPRRRLHSSFEQKAENLYASTYLQLIPLYSCGRGID